MSFSKEYFFIKPLALGNLFLIGFFDVPTLSTTALVKMPIPNIQIKVAALKCNPKTASY